MNAQRHAEGMHDMMKKPFLPAALAQVNVSSQLFFLLGGW